MWEISPFGLGDIVGDVVGGLYKGLKGVGSAIKDAAGAIVNGIKDIADWIGDNAKTAGIAVASIAAITALSYFAPAAIPSVLSGIARVGGSIAGGVSSMWGTLSRIWAGIKSITGAATFQTILKTFRTFHTISRIVSPRYRDMVEQVVIYTRAKSREIFGSAHEISSGLNLVQMALFDLSSLVGKPVDLYNEDFFNDTEKILSRVEKYSGNYTANPGQFWYDIQEEFINPIYKQTLDAKQQTVDEVGRVGRLVSGVNSRVSNLDTRFREYRSEIDAIVYRDTARRIDELHRRFRKDVKEPLDKLATELTTTVEDVENAITSISDRATKLEITMTEIKTITGQPNQLDTEQRGVQRRRISSILDSVIPVDRGDETRDLRDKTERIEGILERL